jgi:superfamily I DNA/RNA helicase
MELTQVQKQIIETEKPKVLVLSSAASGKSAVIVERIRYLLEQGVTLRRLWRLLLPTMQRRLCMKD